MGYDEKNFWSKTPKTIQVYFKAFETRMKREYQLAWYNGLCVKSAISSSVFACGLADKNTARKLPKFIEQPFVKDFKKKDVQIEELTGKKKEMELQRFEAYMNVWMRKNNKKKK